jgi:hypothetical protein
MEDELTTPNTFHSAIRRWTYHSPGRTRRVTVSPESLTFRVFRKGLVRYERGQVRTVTRSRTFGSSSVFTFYDKSGMRLKYLLAPMRARQAEQVLTANGWTVTRE